MRPRHAVPLLVVAASALAGCPAKKEEPAPTPVAVVATTPPTPTPPPATPEQPATPEPTPTPEAKVHKPHWEGTSRKHHH